MIGSQETAAATPSQAEGLAALYQPIAAELAEVENLLREGVSSGDEFVNRLVRHSFRLGGKRLRPALVLMCGRAVDRPTPSHARIAAAVELIHTATLIHDDVLDEASIRRHLDTVNARWNNETSVLLGDYLLTQALCLLASLDDNHASRTVGQTARIMCEGELRQVASRGNYDLSEQEYFSIIGGKTAALIGCCCELGGHYAGGDNAVCQALSEYGRLLGLAFQIADDLLDLVGDEALAGKSLGTDLVKQKATLPLIWLLNQVTAGEREAVLGMLANGDQSRRERLRPWLERHGAIDYARAQAQRLVREAQTQLSVLPSSPARESLHGLARFALERKQ